MIPAGPARPGGTEAHWHHGEEMPAVGNSSHNSNSHCKPGKAQMATQKLNFEKKIGRQPPADKDAEAGAGDPAPCEGAVPYQPNSKQGRRRGEK